MCKLYKVILFQNLSFLDLILEAYRPESDWKSPENLLSCLASAWIANGNSSAHISKDFPPREMLFSFWIYSALKMAEGHIGKKKTFTNRLFFPLLLSWGEGGWFGDPVTRASSPLQDPHTSPLENISRSQRLLCWLHIRCIFYIGWKWKQHWIFAFPDKWIYWGSTS